MERETTSLRITNSSKMKNKISSDQQVRQNVFSRGSERM